MGQPRDQYSLKKEHIWCTTSTLTRSSRKWYPFYKQWYNPSNPTSTMLAGVDPKSSGWEFPILHGIFRYPAVEMLAVLDISFQRYIVSAHCIGPICLSAWKFTMLEVIDSVQFYKSFLFKCNIHCVWWVRDHWHHMIYEFLLISALRAMFLSLKCRFSTNLCLYFCVPYATRLCCLHLSYNYIHRERERCCKHTFGNFYRAFVSRTQCNVSWVMCLFLGFFKEECKSEEENTQKIQTSVQEMTSESLQTYQIASTFST